MDLVSLCVDDDDLQTWTDVRSDEPNAEFSGERFMAIDTASSDDSIGKNANEFGVEVHRSANGMVTTS